MSYLELATLRGMTTPTLTRSWTGGTPGTIDWTSTCSSTTWPYAERTSSPSGDALRLVVDAIELVDLEPNELESVVECLLLQILRAVLASVRLPLTALRAGAFELVPTAGPLVQDDQIEMFGTV